MTEGIRLFPCRGCHRAARRRAAQRRATSYWTFGYDPRHQIVSANGPGSYVAEFGYTAGGRLDYADIAAAAGLPGVAPRNVDYDYGGASDPEAVDALRNPNGSAYASFTYDDNGNVLSKTVGSAS